MAMRYSDAKKKYIIETYIGALLMKILINSFIKMGTKNRDNS
jgi:hypothetical protein